MWTNEQMSAIRTDGNLLVAAAAGSGKTAVLTERVARLVTEGADIRDFLVATFTNAAADEMKRRIESRLYAAAEEEVRAGRDGRALREAAQNVGGAHICTLHAFCSHLLRRHFQEAGLDPAFRVGDDAELRLIEQDVCAELMEEWFDEGGRAFSEQVELFGGEEAFTAMILELYRYMRARPDPFSWLDEAVGWYAMDRKSLESSPHVREILDCARMNIQAAVDELEWARENTDIVEILSVLDDDLSRLRSLRLKNGYDDLREAVNAITYEAFPRKGAKSPRRAAVKAARDRAKKLITDTVKPLLAEPLEVELERLTIQRPAMELLRDAVRRFDGMYAKAKSSRKLIDYSDMEHMAVKILSDPGRRALYRRRFQYVFVDEYQDISPVQERILSSVSREGGRFMVGDIKQSIYRFRLADPSLFIKKYNEYGVEGGTRIDLNKNFRSSKAVIGAVNAVFSHIMTQETGEIDYDGRAALVMGREEGEGSAELHLIQRTGGAKEDAPEEAQDVHSMENAGLEALLAARRIRELMAVPAAYNSGEGLRNLRYCDFAVLLRSVKGVADTWLSTLTLEGIPASVDTDSGFFEAVEVRVFLDLLRLIDNRRQDIPLLAVLRSPIGGFSTEELIKLRETQPSGSLLDCILQADHNTPWGEKGSALLKNLDRWRLSARLYTLDAFIGMLLDETDFYYFAGALPGGRQRQANLDMLVERARAYGKYTVRGLWGFIRFMDRVSRTGGLGPAQTDPGDAVRILTVHKSKGLEFPVVILSGLGQRFSTDYAQNRLLAGGELGIGVRCVYRRQRLNPLICRAIAVQKRRELIADEMRILYVGMTRARERLILTGTARASSIGALLDAASLALTSRRVRAANCQLDWLLHCIMDEPGGNVFRERIGLSKLDGNAVIRGYFHPVIGSALAKPGLDEAAYFEWAARAQTEERSYFEGLFKWSYPYEADTLLPSKVSVTGLSGNAAELDEKPAFLQSADSLSAARTGTAWHTLLCRISLSPHTEDSVRREIGAIVESGFLTGLEASSIDVKAITAFFNSPLGKRLAASLRVERELNFNYLVSASALMVADTDEAVMLQGVIDCCFLEDGQWVLLDYKTDRIPKGENAQLTAMRHREQLSLYARALSRLTGIPVKEKYVCLLRERVNVSLPD